MLEEDGNTLLTGPVIDQAALHGLLKKVRDLGLPLVSVVQVQIHETHQYQSKKGVIKMNSIKKPVELEDMKISVKLKLSALWAAVMFCYIYGDHFSLFRTGQIADMMAGKIGPFTVSQGSLLGFSLFMAVPGVMVFLSLVLKPKVNRWTNIVLGVFYILSNSVSAFTDSWIYFIVYGVIEVALTALIVWQAWKWPKLEG